MQLFSLHATSVAPLTATEEGLASKSHNDAFSSILDSLLQRKLATSQAAGVPGPSQRHQASGLRTLLGMQHSARKPSILSRKPLESRSHASEKLAQQVFEKAGQVLRDAPKDASDSELLGRLSRNAQTRDFWSQLDDATGRDLASKIQAEVMKTENTDLQPPPTQTDSDRAASADTLTAIINALNTIPTESKAPATDAAGDSGNEIAAVALETGTPDRPKPIELEEAPVESQDDTIAETGKSQPQPLATEDSARASRTTPTEHTADQKGIESRAEMETSPRELESSYPATGNLPTAREDEATSAWDRHHADSEALPAMPTPEATSNNEANPAEAASTGSSEGLDEFLAAAFRQAQGSMEKQLREEGKDAGRASGQAFESQVHHDKNHDPQIPTAALNPSSGTRQEGFQHGFSQSENHSPDLSAQTTTAGRTTGSGSPDPLRETLFAQVMEKAQLFRAGQQQQVLTLQLKPEHLGKLNMELTSKDGTVSARILTESQLVRAKLEELTPQIKEQLAGQGINLSEITVDVSSQHSDGNNSQLWERQHGRFQQRSTFEQEPVEATSIDVLQELRRRTLHIGAVDLTI